MTGPIFDIADEETTNRIENKPKGVVIKFISEPSIEQLASFLEAMGSHFFRIKGFVDMDRQWFKVDTVNDRIDIVPYAVEGEVQDKAGFNELVCLSSQGIKSISHLADGAETYLSGLYTIEM